MLPPNLGLSKERDGLLSFSVSSSASSSVVLTPLTLLPNVHPQNQSLRTGPDAPHAFQMLRSSGCSHIHLSIGRMNDKRGRGGREKARQDLKGEGGLNWGLLRPFRIRRPFALRLSSLSNKQAKVVMNIPVS